MTLKASPLSNRGYERGEHPRTPIVHNNMHPEGVPHHHNSMAYTKLIYSSISVPTADTVWD